MKMTTIKSLSLLNLPPEILGLILSNTGTDIWCIILINKESRQCLRYAAQYVSKLIINACPILEWFTNVKYLKIEISDNSDSLTLDSLNPNTFKTLEYLNIPD